MHHLESPPTPPGITGPTMHHLKLPPTPPGITGPTMHHLESPPTPPGITGPTTTWNHHQLHQEGRGLLPGRLDLPIDTNTVIRDNNSLREDVKSS